MEEKKLQEKEEKKKAKPLLGLVPQETEKP